MTPVPCTLLGGGELRPAPHWRLPPHLHSSNHELILILGGGMRLKTPNSELLATSGDLLFYQRGMVHEEISQSDDPVGLYYIAFQAGKRWSAGPLRTHDSDGRVRQLFTWLIHDMRQGRPYREAQPLLQAILSEWQKCSLHPKDPWLEQVLKFMRRHFAEKLSLDSLSLQARMSRFAFIRKFKRLHGHTPMEELRRIRLHEARNMILGTCLPLKMIAPSVGIGDEYQLSKLFRRLFGLSPRQMREKKGQVRTALR